MGQKQDSMVKFNYYEDEPHQLCSVWRECVFVEEQGWRGEMGRVKSRLETVDGADRGREEIENTKSKTRGLCLCPQQEPFF